MDLSDLRSNWDALGRQDPMWAVLSYPANHGNRWDRDAFFLTGERHVATAMARLDELGVAPERGRALDFGCGVGRLTQALARRFERVDGVDIAPSMIEQARANNPHGDRVEFHVNDRPDLSLFPDATFNFVLSLIVLQHVENRFATRYIQEFLRLLHPGGVAQFNVPSRVALNARGLLYALTPGPVAERYRRRRYGYDGVMEMHGMRRRRVEAVITGAGGRVIDVRSDPLAGTDWRSLWYIVTKP